MSRVVYRPPMAHSCRPGSVLTPADPDGPLAGQTLVSAPRPDDFPRGTVWECDCGTRWVSLGATDMTDGYTHWVDVVRWKREGWFARWRRTRMGRLDD